MKKSIPLVFLAGALGIAALTGSGSSPTGGSTQQGSPSSASSSPAGSGPAASAPAAAGPVVLKTASTSLGTIVVNEKGMAVYFFDKDTANSGKSACDAGCSMMWPAVKAATPMPGVDGVTGKVGTISRDDGTLQATVNGRPVYTYAKDMAAGDVKGQGVGGIWWAVAPGGDKVSGSTPGSSGY